jgi:hypothetical protein
VNLRAASLSGLFAFDCRPVACGSGRVIVMVEAADAPG